MRYGSTLLLLLAALLAPTLAARADGPPTAADLAETREVRWSDPDEPDLLEKASELGTAAAIYELVRNEFDFALYDGSRSSSTNVFLNRRGNDVDLASTLIAMLRSQAIPARYATGIVSVSFAELTSWLEIPNLTRATTALSFAGFQNVSNSDRTSFTHAWVQAFVPLARYRGTEGANPIDCMATPAVCTWVDLDPSFKQRRYRDPAELVDVSETVLFDYESYYRAEDPGYTPPDGLDRREKSPLEVYEEMILQHLHTTPGLEGRTLEDVVYEGEIIEEKHGILPTSAPFRFDPAAVSTYSSVDDHDVDAAHVDWTKTVSFTVRFPKHPELNSLTLSGGAPVPLAALADESLIVAYESTDFDDPGTPKALVTRLGDQVHATLFTLQNGTFTWSGGSAPLSQPPDVDTAFDVTLTMQGNGTFPPLTAVYPDLALGGSLLVATGGEYSGFAEVRRSARRLLESVEQSPVLDDGLGVLYVDQNANGAIDPGEPTLLEDAATQRKLTGGVLAIARDLYYAQVRAQLERLTKLQRTTMPPSGFLGVVSSVHDVKTVDGTAFSVTPVGLLVDMKAIIVTPPYKIDEDSTQHPSTFRLAGHIGSSLEHEIWQELTGFEAISTMKGIQRTSRDGGILLELDEGQTQVTIAAAMTSWGFGQTLPSGITSVDLALFSHNIWSPRTTSTGSTKTLSVIRETVTAGESALEKRGWDLEVFRMTNGSGNVYGTLYENLFRFVYDNYTLFQGYPPSTQIQPPHNLAVSVLGFEIGGCATYTTTGQAVSGYPGCFAALMDRPELQGYRDYLDFFDQNQGFTVADHLYRDTDPALHLRAASLAPLRDEIVLGADQNKDGIPDGDKTTEIVIPSRVANGELLDFAVWIQRYLDASGIEFTTGYIINRAGGGYVWGASTTIPWLDTGSFNNTGFTDKAVISSTNNSPLAPRTGDPIATTTGNVFHDAEELRIKGRDGLDYVFTRTYNSAPTQADAGGLPMGHKWSHAYHVRLLSRDHGQEPNDPAPSNSDGIVSSLAYVDERGGEHLFGVSGTGPLAGWTVTGPRGNFDTLDLSQGAGGTYIVRFRNGTEYVFGSADLGAIDQTARLEAIRDPTGNQLTMGYTAGRLTSVQDNLGVAGRTGLALSYFPDGRLQQIADWTGRTWSYTYDPTGNLATASNPLSDTTRYAYAPGTSLLTRVERPEDRDSDGSGDVVTTFDYYENGRGYANADAFGHGETVEYDLFRKRTRITGPRDFVSSHFYDANGELTKLTQPDGGISTFQHNPNGRRWERTNPLGFATRYAYCTARTLDGCASDAGGNVTLERDPLGGTVEYDYELALFDQITRRKDENDAEHLAVYYPADDPGTGAVRGKLHQRRIAQLGSFSDVLLQELTYHPDGTVDERIDYLDPGDPTRKRTTSFTYTDNGLNVQEILVTGSDGTSRRRTFTYDALGRVKTETLERRTSPADPTLLALTTILDYDAADRVIRVTDPLGNQGETDYDANGNVTEIRFLGVDPQTGTPQPPRVVERRTYDDADRLIEVRDVFDAATAIAYDEAGNRTRVTDPTGVSRRLAYDARNRVVAVTDENGHRRTIRYDLGGRLVAEIDPKGEVTTFGYDAAGRLVSRTDPLGNATTFRVDGVGHRVGRTDPNANADPGNLGLVNAFGESATREFDELGRLVRVIDAQDQVTRFEHDLLGNRSKVIDAKSQATEHVYDDLGRPVEIIDPVIETPVDRRDTFVFDEAGNVIEATDREGHTVRTTYDVLNRPVLREWLTSGGTETLAYDAFGNLEQIANSEVAYSFGYDAKSRLTSQLDSRLGRSLQFEYDAADRLIEKTDYQGDVTRFLYDGTGRLVAEQSDAYLQVSYHFDPAGRLLNRILSSGAQTDYTYDEAGRLTALTQRAADGTLVASSIFAHDANGNILSDGAGVYTYDPLDRLLFADRAGTAGDRSYTYDPAGNRDTLTIGSESFDYISGDGNRLLEIRRIPDGTLVNSFDYDANGAVVAKKDATGNPVYTLTRDDRGRVAAATGPGFANAFGYDPRGLRVRRDDSAGSHRFHLEGDRLEAVYDAGGTVREQYLRGSVIDEVVNAYLFDAAGKPTNLTYHHDPVTSVVAVTGHAGILEETIAYSPFGEELSSAGASANTLRFTGRERDPDTGLYYFRARYYDPEIGRFLREDPLGFGGGDVNLYAYAANNPLRFNDPTGKCLPWCVTIPLGAAIGAGSGVATAAITGGDVWQGAWVGALTGGVVGATFGAGATAIVGSLGASEFGAVYAGGIAVGAGSGVAGSALPQAFEYGLDSVDWGIAIKSGLAGAAVAALPSLVAAGASTATAVGGGALYSTGQQAAVSGALGFYDVAASSAAGLLLSDYTTQPTPYETPTDFDISFPTTDTNFDFLNSLYNCCKP